MRQNHYFDFGHMYSYVKLNFKMGLFLAFFDLRPPSFVNLTFYVMGRFSQFGGTRNGTSGAKIKILRSPTPQTSPKNPQKATLGTQIGPQKVIFCHFAFFLIFLPHFPLSTGHYIKCQIYQGRWPQIKKCLKQTCFKIQFYIYRNRGDQF